jgi:hypothetical protein
MADCCTLADCCTDESLLSTEYFKAVEDANTWCVNLFKDGKKKSSKRLRQEVAEVKKTIEHLKREFKREMPQDTVRRVARLVHNCWSKEYILAHPKTLQLPEHNSKWQEVFLPKLRQDEVVVCERKRLKVQQIYNIPVHMTQHLLTLYNRQLAAETDLSNIAVRDEISPLIIQAADSKAIEPLTVGLEKDKHLVITADHIEYYSDAFMITLDALLQHPMDPQNAPVSAYDKTICNHNMRRAIAATLKLEPPPAWNDGGMDIIVGAVPLRTRRQVCAFIAPHESLPSAAMATDTWEFHKRAVNAEDNFFTDKSRVRTRFALDTPGQCGFDEVARTMRTILKDHKIGDKVCCPISLAAWADMHCIVQDATGTSVEAVYIDSALLEFHSTRFLVALAELLTGCEHKGASRAEAINGIICKAKGHPLPILRFANGMPTQHQVRALHRYIASPYCAFSAAEAKLALHSITFTNETHSVDIKVQPGHSSSYPLAFLWLAARHYGLLAAHKAARAKLYGCVKSSVDKFEDSVAQIAYEGRAGSSTYKSTLVKLLEGALLHCSPIASSCCDTRLAFRIKDPQDIALLRALVRSCSDLNSEDCELLRHVACDKNKITLRKTGFAQLSDRVIHVLLEVLCNSVDNEPCAPYHKYTYPPVFKHGFFRNLQNHPPPLSADC